MTHFEYLTVAFGLLYSIAALRLLGGLSVAMAPDSRYWAHLLLTFALLLHIAAGFWTFWSLQVAGRAAESRDVRVAEARLP